MMYEKLIITVLLPAIGALSWCSHVRADEAQSAYTLALNSIKVARTPFIDGLKMSFVEVRQDHSGDQVSTTRVLQLEANGEENITSSQDANNRDANSSDVNADEEMNWQSAILVNPERFPENVALLRETETNWVFILPALVKVEMEDPEQAVDSDDVNDKVASALISELTVSKQSPRFLSLETYSQKPFKPDTLVTVKEFRVSIEYAPAWENGPLITRSFSRKLKGSYALFMSVEEQSNIIYQQFQPLAKD